MKREIQQTGICFRNGLFLIAASAFFSLITSASGKIDSQAVTTQVTENSGEKIVVEYNFGDFTRSEIKINDTEYSLISLGNESLKMTKGEPALPDVSRSIVIPDNSHMVAHMLSGKYHDIQNIDIAPSKGYISRKLNPADIPYTFSDTYTQDAFFPASTVQLHDPYILRDIRGAVLTVNPFQYNPVTHTLRVYTEMTLEITSDGPGRINTLPESTRKRTLTRSFYELYRNHFLNYDTGQKYTPLNDFGDMLIICYDEWIPNIQPLADYKNSVGINTTVVGVSTIGNNSSAIKSYIQSVYDSSDLAFVLLVGDSSQVHSAAAAGGSSDPSYSLLAGNDTYPDIIVGRFSAQTAAQVDTQVQRTIEYEQLPATTQDWFWKGVGVASDQGAGVGDDGEADFVHMDNIRDDLLANGYTQVDQIYDPTATAAQVRNSLNAGRGIVDYCGHGSIFSWGTTGFDTGDINSLTNVGTLPFIFDVACDNGIFDGYTCFAETWLRATYNGEPTGAVGIYASSVSQYWAPPMAAEDEFVDQYVAQTYTRYGTLCYAGSCLMMDEYPPGNSEGSGADMFLTWHIFGDPSLCIVGTATPPTGLGVSPRSSFDSEGQHGGPFTPDSVIYTLTNYDASPIDYTITADINWLDIDNSTGTIPAGGEINVNISINSQANVLPNGLHEGNITFVNTTNHDGDTARDVSLNVGVPVPIYVFDLNLDPQWTYEGAWAFGQPTGGGSGDHGGFDPTSGHTGVNVIGYNLNGDYTNDMPERHLTTSPIDCSNLSQVTLKFWRWLGVEQPSYDHAYVRVSNDGTHWTTIWENGSTIDDHSWSLQELDISGIADHQPQVYIRWTMGTTDTSWVYCGWNIDDIEIWGVEETPQCPEDLNGDGIIDQADLGILMSAYGSDDGGDINGDGVTDQVDLGMLMSAWGTTCQ